jgi:hypothetical protein
LSRSNYRFLESKSFLIRSLFDWLQHFNSTRFIFFLLLMCTSHEKSTTVHVLFKTFNKTSKYLLFFMSAILISDFFESCRVKINSMMCWIENGHLLKWHKMNLITWTSKIKHKYKVCTQDTWLSSSTSSFYCYLYYTIIVFWCLFLCLFVWLFWAARASFSYLAAVAISSDKAENLDVCLVLMAFRSESSFTCHTYCDTGPPFLRSPEYSTLGEGAITTYFNVLGLTRLAWARFELTTSWMLSESDTTRLSPEVVKPCF